jgi:hypothetical protein
MAKKKPAPKKSAPKKSAKKTAAKKPAKKTAKKQAETQQKKDFNAAEKRLKKQNITLQSGITAGTSTLELKRRGYTPQQALAISKAFTTRRSTTRGEGAKVTTAEKRFRAESEGTTISKVSTKPKRGGGRKKDKKGKTVAAGKKIEANVRQGKEKKSNARVVSRAMVLKPRKSKTSKSSGKAKGKQRNNQGRRR